MIIAEIGINHEGSEMVAHNMLAELLETSIDAITFQIPSEEYLNGEEPKRTPLSNQFYKEAISQTHLSKKLIGFACGDANMVELLDDCGTDFWKTLSFDIFNEELQNMIQKTSKLTYISTGISSIDDIVKANKMYKNIKFIHTQVSNDIKDVNLQAIDTIKKETNRDVAYGQHCNEKKVIYISMVYKPSDIFFYVKESNSNEYPDGPHAIVIDEVEQIIQDLNNLKQAMGDGQKLAMERKWK